MGVPFLSPFGMRIVETDMVGDAWQDWSGVRSPSRARRRLRQGHPQRIVTRYRANGTYMHDQINGVIYAHPHDVVRLRQALAAQSTHPIEKRAR